MSELTRTPGRIEEAATPVGVPAAAPPDSGYAGTEGPPQSVSGSDYGQREPGPVEGPSEALPDEHVPARSLVLTGPAPGEHSPWRFIFRFFAFGVFIWLSYEAGSAIAGVWRQSVWLGLPLALLAGLFIVALLRALRREYKALNAIDTLAERRARMHAALASNNLPELRAALEPALENLRHRHPGRIAEFEEAAQTRETAAEYLKQFDNIVLTPLDREAADAINRSAFTGGVAVAIIPHPSLDAAVALWRAARLIRRIGEIYGLEPTGLSSLRLLRHAIATAIIAAGSDVAADAMLQQVGTEATNKMFSRLGEGSVTAWRLYRLGSHARKLCRPITD